MCCVTFELLKVRRERERETKRSSEFVREDFISCGSLRSVKLELG